MSKFELHAELREAVGKEKAKKLRAVGKFPAIVYGADAEPTPITLSSRDVEVTLSRLHGESVLVDLHYGNRTDKVFVRNVQRDPLSEKLVHVDFFRVNPDREIETAVHVIPVGVAEGVRLGGMLEAHSREVVVRALPARVPAHIEVDVTNLKAGQTFHVSDLAPIEGVKLVTHGEVVLFAVLGKQKDDAPEGAAAAAAAGAEKK